MSHPIRDADGWEMLARDVKFTNPHLEVAIETVRTPSRPQPRPWTVVRRKAAVVIAPITAAGEFVLIKQERVPVRTALWEFPAGQIDETLTPDEALIRETALRELREEAGYELAPGGELIPVGFYFPSQGFTDELCHQRIARPVVPATGGHAHDESESILDCRAFTPGELRRMIANNEIRDANTLAFYARLCAMGFV